jgi:hypothetical protein
MTPDRQLLERHKKLDLGRSSTLPDFTIGPGRNLGSYLCAFRAIRRGRACSPIDRSFIQLFRSKIGIVTL